MVSAIAIIGLIVVSLLMIDVFVTSNVANPLSPGGQQTPPPPPPLTNQNGTLVIFVTSNQNATNKLALPTNVSSDAQGVPIRVTYTEATRFSTGYYEWTTNGNGLTGCISCLPVGLYIVTLLYNGVNLTIPAHILAGNQTTISINFRGEAYPLIYSDESGILVTPTAAQYSLFAQVSSGAPVVGANQPVILNVVEGASGTIGYSVNATVVSQAAPAKGMEWLQLGTPSRINLFDASSISMTAWSSTWNSTTGEITYLPGSLK